MLLPLYFIQIMICVFLFLALCKHYDGVILPEIKDNLKVNTSVAFRTRAKNKLVGIFKTKRDTTAATSDEQSLIDVKSLSHSDHVELRKSALTFYLNGLHDVLYGPESMEDPISIVRTVHAIYSTLHNSYVFFSWHEAEWKLQGTADVRFLNLQFPIYVHTHCNGCLCYYYKSLLLQAMYEFLSSAAATLLTKIKDYPGFTILMKILVLLMIFFKCRMLSDFSQTNHPVISCLLKNLAVKDESSLKIISTDFFIHYQKMIKDVLELLISNCVKLKPPVAEWIFAVPMLHFVMQKCKPFEQLEEMTWNHDNLTRQVY